MRLRIEAIQPVLDAIPVILEELYDLGEVLLGQDRASLGSCAHSLGDHQGRIGIRFVLDDDVVVPGKEGFESVAGDGAHLTTRSL